MNRLVLIGNGFDIAHGLNTRYENFIYWYWEQRFLSLYDFGRKTFEDELCAITTLNYSSWYELFFNNHVRLRNLERKEYYKLISNKKEFEIKYTPLFDRIHKSIETKRWVDIENDYYELLKNRILKTNDISEVERLNSQLRYIQDKLIDYLKSIEISDKLMKSDIRQKIYAPFKIQDVSIEGQQALNDHVEYGLKLDKRSLDIKIQQYDSICYSSGRVEDCLNKMSKTKLQYDELPDELFFPNQIMLLNFNYTHTAHLYLKKGSIFMVDQIHGDLDNPSSIIFGYGDELDSDYKKIVDKNDNRILRNIKSIKYLEADNYRRVLSFIEAEPYQILVMGHSCGNSDRTLLNTLFEHKNCVSIKPYFYKWGEGEKDDNYIELVQNISRNFKDMKLMRDRVVNKTYCEPLTNRNNF